MKNVIQKQSPRRFCKKGVRAEACNFIKKDAIAQVFSCEFCEISKDPYSNLNTSGGGSGIPLVFY